ncbi:MAG: MTH1187 family thiamine-binding protein [Candidatus Freyarchaeota archaeon]
MMNMTVVVEFNIIPLGEGVSVSKFLVPALRELDRLGVRYNITPMCTIFEAKSVKEAFHAIKAAHEAVFKAGVKRVITTVKVDDRRDITRSMEEKVKSLERAIKREQ